MRKFLLLSAFLTACLSMYATAPVLVSSVPENGSFDLPVATTSFTITYDVPVKCADVTATLTPNGGSAITLTSNVDVNNVLTLTRVAGDLTAGTYTLSVSGVKDEADVPAEASTTLTLSFGTLPSTTIMTAFPSSTTSATVPTSWTLFYDGSLTRTAGAYGTGPRIFSFASAPVSLQRMMYNRAQGVDAYFEYAGADLSSLTEGSYTLTYKAMGYKASQNINCQIMTTGGSIVSGPSALALTTNAGGVTSGTLSTITTGTVNFTITSAGAHKIRWNILRTGTAVSGFYEVILGGITLVKGSVDPGITYKTNYTTAQTAASGALTSAAAATYDGTTKTALTNLLSTYTVGWGATSPSAYTSAISELNAATTAMNSRKANVDAYTNNLITSGNLITANTGTKYDDDATFTTLQSVYSTYNGVAVSADDATLASTAATIANAMNAYSGYRFSAEVLAYRLLKTAATATTLGIDELESAAATGAVTDDDATANTLRNKIKTALYSGIAAGTQFAAPGTLDMTCYIKNPNLYTRQTTQPLTATSLPGWRTPTSSAGLKTTASATIPVVDSWMEYYNTAIPYIEQTITNLPNGIYELKAFTRTSAGSGHKVIYANTRTNRYQTAFWEGVAPATPMVGTNTTVSGIIVNDGKLTIGFKDTTATANNVYLDNFTLTMTDKLPNIDYNIANTLTYNSAAGDSIWTNTASWTGSNTPIDGGNVAVASGHLRLAQHTSLNNLTLNNGTQLTIPAGDTLKVSGTLTITNGSQMASLMQQGVLQASSIVLQKALTGTNDGVNPNGRYWYLTSPVVGATSGTFSASGNNRMWSYNEAGATLANVYTEITNDVTTLTPGLGYVVRLTDNSTVNFTGTSLATGSIEIPLSYTPGSGKPGFNLIGNPYPSFMNVKTALASNVALEKSLWYRTNLESTGMVFDTYNTTNGFQTSNSGVSMNDWVPPMQAFWVKVTEAGTLTMSDGWRSNQPSTRMLRNASTIVNKLGLQVSNGISSDNAIVAFLPDATDAFEANDSRKMFNGLDNLPEIYTMAGAEPVAINGFAQLQDAKEIAIGFKTATAGKFSIRATELNVSDEYLPIILKDKLLNTMQNLSEMPEYQFTSDATSTISRFSLVIGKMATGMETMQETSFNLFSKGNQLEVTLSGVASAQIIIIDTMGRIIHAENVRSQINLLNKSLSNGVYLVQVNAGGLTETRKVVINQ